MFESDEKTNTKKEEGKIFSFQRPSKEKCLNQAGKANKYQKGRSRNIFFPETKQRKMFESGWQSK
jgi:hypothetical protein